MKPHDFEKKMTINQEPKVTKLNIIKNLILISLAFFLLFTAYDGLSMLQSTMNKKDGVGVVSQAVGYIAFFISALLLPKYVIRKFGCKSSLILSLGLYIPSVAANFYPTWYLMIPASILGGVGASILWGAQCTYFNESAFRYAKLIVNGAFKHNRSPEIPSICTSVETLSIGNSISGTIEENTSINNPFPKYLVEFIDAEHSIGRYRSRNPSISSEDDTEIKSSQYFKNIIEDSSTKHTKEICKFDQTENSLSNSFTPTSAQILETRKELEEKHRQKKTQISNVEVIVRSMVDDVNGMFNKSISKLHDESTFSKRNLDNKSATERNNSLESITGLFFSCHSIAYYAAQICSNAISYYILKVDDDTVVSYSDGCTCGAQFCNDNKGCVSDDAEYVSQNIRYLLTGISVIIGVVSVLLIVFFVDPLKKEMSEDEPENISCSLVAATISHNKKKEQLCLIPMSFFEGMQQGFYTADFTKSYVGCAWGVSNVGLVSVFYGLACVFTSLISGFLVKYAGRKTLFFIGQVICILMMVFLLLWVPDSDTPYKFYVAAMFFGSITGIYWSQLLSFYGLLFKKDEEAAFASYYLWSSLGWTTSFLYSDHLCTYVKIYLLLVVSIIGSIGYLYTEKSYGLRKKQQGNIFLT